MNNKIEYTTKKDMTKRMTEMVPYFTPEWKFDLDDMDPGSALFKLFLDIHMETIDLFNNVYEKNFVSFLNLFDATLLKPNSARCPVVFVPSSGAETHVLIKEGTKLIARSEDDVVGFSTENMLEVIPTKLKKTIYANGTLDKMVVLEPNEEITLFDFNKKNMQSHELYLSENNMMFGKYPVDFHIDIKSNLYSKSNHNEYLVLTDESKVIWQYYSDGDWYEFDKVTLINNIIVLSKNCIRTINTIQEDDFGFNSRWIRLIIRDGKVFDFTGIKIDRISITPHLGKELSHGIELDRIINNTKNLDTNGLIMPFGNSFYEEDSFYLSCGDVLSKKDADIKISFDLCFDREPLRNNIPDMDWKLIIKQSELNRYKIVDIKIRSIRWEFWNGSRWERLEVVNGTTIFTIEKNHRTSLHFKCPDTIRQTKVSGEDNYYIRGTINGVDNNFATYGRYLVPYMNNIKIRYDYVNDSININSCFIKNNNKVLDMTESINSQTKEFYPFKGIGIDENTLLLCFNKAFGKGPNSLLFVMENDKTDINNLTGLSAFYLKKEKNTTIWKHTQFEDQTNSFNRTGHLVFGNMNQMEKSELFGIEGYWIKFESMNENQETKIIKQIIMNSTWAIQQEYMKSEKFNLPIEEHTVELGQSPILSQNIWVDEYNIISLDEMNEVKEIKKYKEIINEYHELEEFWVLWDQTKDLLSAKSNERVYTLDPISGLVSFGNDINGKRIPKSNKQQISIDYYYGGGTKGNFDTNAITNMDHAIAFIDSVYNPIPSVGGCNHESYESAIDRCSNLIRNRDRAVTIKDVESITKAASRNILKVKCIPNLNNQYEVDQGYIGVLVIPNQSKREKLSLQLKNQIYEYLVKRCPSQIIETIHVSDPVYVTISVYGRFVSKSKVSGRVVNDEIINNIEKFINIKTGNFDGTGWEIGKLPNEIMLHSILSNIKSLQKINSLNIFFNYEDSKGKHIIRSEDLKNTRCMIVNSGEYNIEISQL